MSVVREVESYPVARVLLVGGRDREQSSTWAVLEQSGLEVRRYEAVGEAQGGASEFDVVLLDARAASVATADLVAALRRSTRGLPLVVLVPRDRVDLAVESMRAGAVDCLGVPATTSELLACIRRNLDERIWPGRRLAHPAREVNLIGRSPALLAVRRLLSRAARAGSTAVQVSGPRGAGKTRAASFLHAHHPGTPFIRVTCDGIRPDVLEKALFSEEEPGAGAWVRARGGCLCIEDITQLPLRLQQELEARLDAQEAERTPARLTVRVIGTVREATRDGETPIPRDIRLMSRFAAVHARLPPLADRPGDVRLLATHILSELARRLGRPRMELTPEAWRVLERASWPGNVRELQAVIEGALMRARSDFVEAQDLEVESTADMKPLIHRLPPEGVDLAELEKSLVMQALERTQGNRTKAGLLLGINRDQVRYRIEKFDLEP